MSPRAVRAKRISTPMRICRDGCRAFREYPTRPSQRAKAVQEPRCPAVLHGRDPRLRRRRTAASLQQSWGHWKYPLTVSTPERAILELLNEVPRRETFHQADVLMEGLRNLSPRRLQALLADCRNVKVKRLFFWFAERHNHAWLQKLDRPA